MGVTNYPHGVGSFGMPVLGGGPLMTTGNVFFVDSGASLASNGNDAKSPDRPAATIDGAVGKCTASNGDIIFVMPGHNESLTAATSLVVDVAGVQIIGLGHGNNRPILDYDNTAGTIEMDAANTRLSNIVLRTSVSACVVAINVDADHVTLDNLETTFEATGDDFLATIDIDGVDYCHVYDCVFNTELGATAGNRCIRLDDSLYTIIERCRFVGNWDGAVIHNQGALCQGLILRDLMLYNEDTSNYNGIDVGTLSTTGIVHNVVITALYATAVAKIYRDGDLTTTDAIWLNNAVSEVAIPGHEATGITTPA